MKAPMTNAWLALAVVACLDVGILAPRPASPVLARTSSSHLDPLERRVLDELDAFTEWLDAGNVAGYVGEVGWPGGVDAAHWNRLAARWYRRAAARKLHVDYWATGEWWGADYPLSAYVAVPAYRAPLNTLRSQAEVIERQGRPRRGIVVNGGEFGRVPQTQPTSRFSNRNPGAYNDSWHYDTQASFDFLAARGVTRVKIPFRWERLQPELGRRLDRDELRRLRRVVARVRRAGMTAVLGVHNYGGYYVADGRGRGVRQTIGSAGLPDRLFVDLWRRLSRRFRGNPGVAAYALMAEPAAMPRVDGRPPARVWETSSQRALDAIRRSGDTTLVYVPGYNWSAVATWRRTHPRPWITDPVGRFRYEAHHYWDGDGSGGYGRSYAEEVRAAETRTNR